MKRTKKNKNWPWGFKAGDNVVCNSRYARVVKACVKDVEPGKIPIIFTDRETKPEAFICVPADHLYPCTDKTWKWGPFTAGDPVTYRKAKAQVAMAFRRDVPEGYAPVIFSDSDHAVFGGKEATENIEYVCIDDLYPPE